MTRKKDIYAKLIPLQQKGSIEEYTCEWEVLATRVPGLTLDQLVQTYVSSEQNTKIEIEMHNIKITEKARHKAKHVEESLQVNAKSPLRQRNEVLQFNAKFLLHQTNEVLNISLTYTILH